MADTQTDMMIFSPDTHTDENRFSNVGKFSKPLPPQIIFKENSEGKIIATIFIDTVTKAVIKRISHPIVKLTRVRKSKQLRNSLLYKGIVKGKRPKKLPTTKPEPIIIEDTQTAIKF